MSSFNFSPNVFKELFKNKEEMLNLFRYTIQHIIDKLDIDINNQKEFYKSSTTNLVIKLALKEKIQFLKGNNETNLIGIYRERLKRYE